VAVASRQALPSRGWKIAPGGLPPTSMRDHVTRSRLERGATDGESPVGRDVRPCERLLSSAGHETSGVKLGGPPPKATYTQRPIAHSTVREW
jgi:hypothetical protein